MAALICLLATLADGLGAHAETHSSESYHDELEAALTAIERDSTHAGAVAEQLRSIETISLDDGAEMAPDLSRIVLALEANPPRVGPARRQLRTLLTELDRAPATTDETGAALSAVLARSEFRRDARPGPDPSIRERLEDALRWPFDQLANGADWLDRRFGGSSDGAGPGPGRLIIGFFAFILIGGLVFMLARGTRRSLGAPTATLPRTVREAEQTSSASALRGMAAQLAEAGQFRDALRSLYLASLLHWHDRGRINFDRALTDQEILREATPGGAGQPATLGPVIERYEQHWYGRAPCDRREFEEFAGLVAAAWDAPE